MQFAIYTVIVYVKKLFHFHFEYFYHFWSIVKLARFVYTKLSFEFLHIFTCIEMSKNAYFFRPNSDYNISPSDFYNDSQIKLRSKISLERAKNKNAHANFSKVELHVNCINLMNRNSNSKMHTEHRQVYQRFRIAIMR